MATTEPSSELWPRLRRALTGGGAYLLSGVSARLLWLLVLPLIMHRVSPAVFGQYALIRVALFVFRTFCDLGTSTATVRFASTDSAERNELFASLWWGRVALSLLLGTVSFLFASALVPDLTTVISFSLTAFITLALGDALAAVARSQERHRVLAATHVTGAVLEALAVVLLVGHFHWGLVGLAAALALRFAGALLVIAPFTLPAALTRPSRAAFSRLLGFGLPASIAQLISTLGAMDRWLIERLSTLSNVAAYHLGSIPAVVIEVLEQAVLQAAEPWVYGAARDDRPQLLSRLVRAYFGLALVGAVAASLIAPELIALIAPPEYGAALGVVPWLTFAAVMHGGVRVVGIGSGLASQTRPWAWAGLLDLTLAASLLFVALPRWGVAVAAGARFAAATAGLLLCHRLSERVSGLRIHAPRFILWGVLCAAIAAICTRQPLGVRAAALLALGVATAALSLRDPAPRR